MDNTTITKTDLILQFALATAGQEDFANQELGQIHLIKYIYLADLKHAEANNGITYTNLPWRFHHFGPWSEAAYLRIEPALQAIGADKKIIASKYDKDFIRWIKVNEQLYNKLESQLPLIITTTIQRFVHKFNAITEDLLDYVYKTWPMLRAKPGDMLDFNIPEHMKKENKKNFDLTGSSSENLSVRQAKKKSQAMDELKKEFQKRLEEKKRKPQIRFTPPPYDDIYFEGLKTLDLLAGEEIKTIHGIACFSDDIWESKARFDPDVP